jgi:protein-S-isoprenylcysteine O-methyltransferase Ste14
MRGDVFSIAYLAGFAIASAIRLSYARRHSRSEIASRHETVLDVVLVSFAGLGMAVGPVYVFSPWLDFADYARAAWAGWLGVAVSALGLWLLWRSHADLGRNWSPDLHVTREHTLITDGVYRRLRHPMYAAHLLWAVSQVLLLPNWVAGPAMLAFFLPMCLVRIPIEERMMIERFGAEYRAYMARSGCLIPRLRR